jgi:hypothetical protein
LLTAIALLLSACGAAEPEAKSSGGGEKRAKPKPETTATTTPSPDLARESTTPTPTPTKVSKKAELPPAVKCQRRPPKRSEIFSRSMYGDDQPPDAMLRGAGWVWDFGEKECITSVEFALRANPNLPGFCTEVGYVIDNRGYPVDRRPAPPIPNVVASTGDC